MLDTLIKDKPFFKVFINQIECPLIYLSSKGIIEIANDVAINILQLDPKQFVGINIKKFCLEHGYSLSKLFDNDKKSSHSIEESYRINDQECTVLWKSNLLSYSDSCVGDVLLVGYDVTQYSAISDELHKKIFFYENILSKLPTNVYWKDRNCVYLGCNERLANVMGLSSREAIKGMTDFDFSWGKENAKSFIEFDKKVMQSGVPLTTEDVFEEASGKVVTVLTNKTPLKNEAGDTVGVLAISVDITELKQTQMKLEIERQKSEAASRAKSEFIANMSHDIRTPITGILGVMQMFLDEAETAATQLKQPQSSIKPKTLLQRLIANTDTHATNGIAATEQLLQLLNEILEVVKIESGKMDVRPEAFDIRALVQQNIDLLQPVATQQGLDLCAEIAATVPQYVRGLRRYLNRSLLNLISNALKFTKAGSVTVTVAVAEDQGDAVTLKIAVIDTGIGIPPDKFGFCRN